MEATPEQILEWTDGNCIIASGSPFKPITFKGKEYIIGQGNNAFIFPALGYASILAEVSEITDQMVLESALALFEYTQTTHDASGLIYPSVNELASVTKYIVKVLLKNIITVSYTHLTLPTKRIV